MGECRNEESSSRNFYVLYQKAIWTLITIYRSEILSPASSFSFSHVLAFLISIFSFLFHRPLSRVQLMWWSSAFLSTETTTLKELKVDDATPSLRWSAQDDLNIERLEFLARTRKFLLMDAKTSENHFVALAHRTITSSRTFRYSLSTKRWWKTGLNQLRENPTKKRHRKHKKISVSC